MAEGTLVGRGYVSIRPEFEGDWSRQASVQSSRAGDKAGGAFGKAFGGALRGLTKGIIPALGTSAAAAIAPAAGAAGLLAPAILAAVSANAALKIGLSGVGDAMKEAFNPTSPEKLAEAMAKLSPNARAFVKEVRSAKPAFDALKLSVQDRLFKDMASTFEQSAKVTLPIFHNALTNSAGALNLMGRNVLNTAAGLGKSGALGTALSGANQGLYNMASVPGVIVQGLVQVGAAAAPAFGRLTASAGGAFESLSEKMTAAFHSGAMTEFIENGVTVLQGLGRILADAFATVGNVMGAASDAGTQVLAVIGEVFAELRRVTALPEVQAALKSVFLAVSQIAAAIAPIIGAALQAVLPLLAAIAPVLGQLATALGPVVATLVQALGQMLLPIVEALMPAITVLGDALVRVVAAVTPLLAPLGELAALFVEALMPILGPLADLFVQLVEALAGPMQQLVQAFVPWFQLLGQLIADVFGALQPLITPLVTLVSELAEVFVSVFAAAIKAVMSAVEPLIPVFVSLIDQVIAALLPVMPVLSQAFAAVGEALGALLPPIAGIVSQVAQHLAPVISAVVPVIAKLAELFATVLLRAMPPLTDALIILIGAFAPILPLVVDLGVQLIEKLLPPLLDLIIAAVDLVVALTPILPPLAQIISLVVSLATNVLSWLLPPLVDLAALLGGALVDAITKVVGWLTSLVNGIVTVITWVRDKLGPAFTWLNENIIQPVWNAIRNAVKWAWENVIRPVWERMSAWIRDTLAPAFVALQQKVSFAWQVMQRVVASVWTKYMRPTFNAIKTAVSSVATAFSNAKDAIGRAWDKLRDLTRKPINWVINTVWNKGIVKVWDKIAGWIPGVPKLGTLPLLEAGGRVDQGWNGAAPGMFNRPTAIVGEGNPRYPEYVIPTDPKYRGRALALHAAAGTQLLESGGIIGGIKGALSKVGDFFADPIGSAKRLFAPILDQLKSLSSSAWGKAAAGIPRMAIDGLKKLVSTAAGSLLGLGSSGGGGGAGVQRWAGVVQQALRMVGQPAGYTGITLRRMNQESGGNPRAVNLWDINAKLGHPSVGLMQVIRPTFDAYAGSMRGVGPKLHGVSINPLANVYASMRYAMSRYGSLPRAYNRPGGYDDGGWLEPGQVGVNHLRQPEAVLTPSQWRTMQTAAAAGGGGGLQPGDQLTLVVDGQEFHGYVDTRAKGQVKGFARSLTQRLNAGFSGY